MFQTLAAGRKYTDRKKKKRTASGQRAGKGGLAEAGNPDGRWEQVRKAETPIHENQAPGLTSFNEVTHLKKCVMVLAIIKL